MCHSDTVTCLKVKATKAAISILEHSAGKLSDCYLNEALNPERGKRLSLADDNDSKGFLRVPDPRSHSCCS